MAVAKDSLYSDFCHPADTELVLLLPTLGTSRLRSLERNRWNHKISRFGGGASGTLLHPLVAVEMLIAIILILFLPRKYAIVPLAFCVCSLFPLAQVVVLGGIHFTVLRILIIAGLVRRGRRREPNKVSRRISMRSTWSGDPMGHFVA